MFMIDTCPIPKISLESLVLGWGWVGLINGRDQDTKKPINVKEGDKIHTSVIRELICIVHSSK